jgi:hypothetical protein
MNPSHIKIEQNDAPKRDAILGWELLHSTRVRQLDGIDELLNVDVVGSGDGEYFGVWGELVVEDENNFVLKVGEGIKWDEHNVKLVGHPIHDGPPTPFPKALWVFLHLEHPFQFVGLC